MKDKCHTLEQINTNLQDKRYEVLQLLGTGGMACVYLARERQSRHLYAFKILHDKYRHSDKHRMIFRNEAEIMRHFQHPNIVRFYQYTEEDIYAYIRMDYVGITLYEVLNKAKKDAEWLPLSDVVRIIWQLAQGLDYLHHEKQLHLDVKPANILLQDDGRVFLTDLGLTMDTSEVRTYVAGTPYYMPYEQQVGNASVTTSADTYALAVLAYELLVLRRPFELDNSDENGREQLREAHKSASVPAITNFRADLPHKLNAVFEKALAKDPHDRYDVYEFVEALHEVLKPRLPFELQSLQDIQLQTLEIANTQDEEPLVEEETAKGQNKFLVFALILLVFVIVISGVAYFFLTNDDNNQAAIVLEASQTFTSAPTIEASEIVPPVTEEVEIEASAVVVEETAIVEDTTDETPEIEPTEPVATNTATSTATATATATATIPTATPTLTLTPSPEATPTALPTAFLSSEPILFIAEGIDAIGEIGTLSQVVDIFAQENQPLVLLRSGSVNGFYVVMEVANPSAFETYGIVYRYQSEQEYYIFRIVSAMSAWEIVEVKDMTETIIETGATDILPHRIAVAGRDEYFRYEFASDFVQFQQAQTSNGTLGLWVQGKSAEAYITDLQLGLLGQEAIAASENMPTLVPQQVDFSRFLVNDLSLMLESASIEVGRVTCSDFVAQYDNLERHATRNGLAEYVDEAIAQSNFIYNRCQTAGIEETIDLNGSIYNDFLDWEIEIQDIINILTIRD